MKKNIFYLSLMMMSVGILAGCNGTPSSPQTSLPPGSTPITSTPQDSIPPVSEFVPEIEYTIDESLPSSGKDANGADFTVSKVKRVENSPLAGKTIYWLGSSVTYGASSGGEAMAEFLAAKTGAICRKDAVSGTTLFDDGSTGSKSYTRRLTNSTIFKKDEHVDAFICQISTNDAISSRIHKRGYVEDADVQYASLFNKATTLGGVEYIISYVTATWKCPVYFYSGSYFGDPGSESRVNEDPSGSNYAQLVDDVKVAVAKWQELGYDVEVIDMYNDADFNAAVSDEYYKWCTNDPVHPKRAGYLNWWMPYFEQFLTRKLKDDINVHTLSYARGAYAATGDIPEAKEYEVGEEIVLAADTTFAMEGYTIDSWSDGSYTYDCGSVYIMPDHDVTLKAIWTNDPNATRVIAKSVMFEDGYFVFSGSVKNIKSLYVYLNNTYISDSMDNCTEADIINNTFTAYLPLDTLIGYAKNNQPFNLRYKIDSTSGEFVGVAQGMMDLSQTYRYKNYDFRFAVNDGSGCVAVYYSPVA